jgi:predicted nucleic acid-binding protein
MKAVFADTAYWIAVALPKDGWHNAAKTARADLGPVAVVTTDEVLTEFLAAFSKCGSNLRGKAVTTVRAIMSNANIKVVPQSRDSFQKGLHRYETRPDKHYSLQDCISMNVMESEGISEVLTSDHHFEQEGFTVLMNRTDRSL